MIDNRYINGVALYVLLACAAVLLLGCPGGGAGEGDGDEIFIISGGSWSTLLDALGTMYTDYNPQVAFYEARKANAVWAAQYGSFYAISNHFDGSSWAGSIERSSQYGISRPQIASNWRGTSFALWAGGTTYSHIYSSTITGGSWAAENELTTDSYSYSNQVVASFPSSDAKAYAVWLKGSPTNKMQGARYTSGWTLDGDISANNGSEPQITVNENGNALAVWRENNNPNYRLISSLFSGSTWGSDVNASTNNVAFSTSPLDVAYGPSSVAIAVWHSSDDDHIYANRFSGSWAAQTDISGANGATPSIAFDLNGNAFAVWEDTGSNEIKARRFSSGSTWPNWEAATFILSDGGNASKPKLAVDPGGNIFFIWVEDGQIKTKRYNSSVAWLVWGAGSGSADTLDSNSGNDNPFIAVDENGRAIAIWQRSNDIFSKRYFE